LRPRKKKFAIISSQNLLQNKKQLPNQENTRKTTELSAIQARRPGKMAGPGLALCAEASFFLDFFVSFCTVTDFWRFKTKRKLYKETLLQFPPMRATCKKTSRQIGGDGFVLLCISTIISSLWDYLPEIV
jgi:hypothetical protein